MKRVMTLVAAIAVALGAGAWTAGTRPATETGAVIFLSVVPTSGRAEVVIGVNGAVTIQDFALHAPERIVVDITGASLGLGKQGYDRVARGGIVDVTYSQYRPNIVRIVVKLDAAHGYSLARDSGTIRLAVDGGNASFAPWQTGTVTAVAGANDATTPAPLIAPAEKPRATPLTG